MEKPNTLTQVKVVQHSLLVRTVFAIDDEGRIWKRVEGIGNAEWKLHLARRYN